jgi:small subunit ribosomal protein S17
MSDIEITRGNRKERIGVVVSDIQDKTIVVRVDRRTPHLLQVLV